MVGDSKEQYFLAVGERILGHEKGAFLYGKTEIQQLQPKVILPIGEYQQVHYSVALFDEEQWPETIDRDQTVGLRSMLMLVQSEEEYALLATASQLVSWHESFKFCPRCATSLSLHDHERAKVCGSCGHHQYPRISPCIIVLVRKGNQCLLAHAARFAPGRYSTLAGFIEAGESAEAAVAREVMEEVGIEITNLRYCFSQSWPFPHSLMLGYLADYKEGEITPDGLEIIDARWFSVDDMPILPPRFTIARRLINQFLTEIGEEIEPDSALFFAAE